jgi:tRNA(Ile)-lysidine synthase
VLLHAAATAFPEGALHVAHVHHGLQPEADDWLAFCRASAARHRLPFLARRLPALPERFDGGIEAWARRMRYRKLAEMAAEADADVVLTAHHANDQLETHHLRRLRGAGALGLGGMRSHSPLPGAPQRLLLRPFLDVERSRIETYAAGQGLDWVDDPSNQDLRFARNRLRRQLAQTLLEAPSALDAGLAAIGGFQATADAAARQAAEDLASCRLLLSEREGPLATAFATAATLRAPLPVPLSGASLSGASVSYASLPSSSLSRAALARLPRGRAAEAIRLWLRQAGCRMPSRAKNAEVLRQLVDAASTHARLSHDGIWLLRYRDRIDVAPDLPASLVATSFRWSDERFVNVAGHRFVFDRVAPATGRGVDPRWLATADLVVDRPRSVDRLRLTAGGCSRTWKNLAQERGLPPWIRDAVPVLRRGGELLFAAPFGMNRDAARDNRSMPGAASEPKGPDPSRSTDGAPPWLITIEWLAPAQVARWL